ncbi:MAG: hypothetical protein R2838_22100 [Caldilineaceae bacterium]
MDLAAHALEQCRVELDKAAELLGVLGDEIDDIRIPRLSPRFVEVMGVRGQRGGCGRGQSHGHGGQATQGRRNPAGQGGRRPGDGGRQDAQPGRPVDRGGADLQSVGDQLGGSGELLRSLSLLDLGPQPRRKSSKLRWKSPAATSPPARWTPPRRSSPRPGIRTLPAVHPSRPKRPKRRPASRFHQVSIDQVGVRQETVCQENVGQIGHQGIDGKEKTTTTKSPAKSTTGEVIIHQEQIHQEQAQAGGRRVLTHEAPSAFGSRLPRWHNKRTRRRAVTQCCAR